MHASRLTRIGVLLAIPALGALAATTASASAAAAPGPRASTRSSSTTCRASSTGALNTSGALFDATITDPHSVSGVYDYAWINPDNQSYKLTGLGVYNSSKRSTRSSIWAPAAMSSSSPAPSPAA